MVAETVAWIQLVFFVQIVLKILLTVNIGKRQIQEGKEASM